MAIRYHQPEVGGAAVTDILLCYYVYIVIYCAYIFFSRSREKLSNNISRLAADPTICILYYGDGDQTICILYRKCRNPTTVPVMRIIKHRGRVWLLLCAALALRKSPETSQVQFLFIYFVLYRHYSLLPRRLYIYFNVSSGSNFPLTVKDVSYFSRGKIDTVAVMARRECSNNIIVLTQIVVILYYNIIMSRRNSIFKINCSVFSDKKDKVHH